MQKDESHDAAASGLPRSPLEHDASSGGFALSPKLRDKLEKLAKWRIDESSFEFPKDAPEFRGGNATVVKAFLASPSGDIVREDSSDPTKSQALDPDRPEGETSSQRKPVAVKKMNMSDDREKVLGLTLREAGFLVDLSHVNIIKLEGFVENISEDTIWLVFPWEDNGTLRDFIASAEWEIPERVWLIDDVARGVEHLHGRQPPIRHGDLKSINILVNSKCRAIITDFGSARRLTANDPDKATRQTEHKPQAALSLEATFCTSTNTMGITLSGDRYTLRWAPPEVLREEEVCLGSDIWALGWVAYEVMTNSIPFQDVVKDAIVIRRVIQGDLPSITGHARMSLIQALCSLMLACWNIEPRRRPTAKDFRKSINWMPMIVPNPIRTTEVVASMARSPALLMQLGDMYRIQDDYTSALECYTNALGRYRDIGDTKGNAAALVRLATVHRLRDEYSQAVTFYSEALEIRTDIGDRNGRAAVLWGLAEVHLYRSEYNQAATFYSEVLQIRTDIGDRQGRAAALQGLAQVHRFQQEYSQAVAFYSEALQICTDIGKRQGRADALLGLAHVHRFQKEYSQAITFYSEALQICTDIGNRQGRADALKGLADVHQAREEYSEAVTFHTEALQICTDIANRLGRAHVLRSLGEIHRLQHDYSQAIALNSESLEICNDIGDRKGSAHALLNLADAHRDQGHSGDAISRYTEAIEIFERIGDTRNAAYASEEVAKVRRLSKGEEAA